MIYKLVLVLLLSVTFSIVSAQTKANNNLYLLFDGDYKVTRSQLSTTINKQYFPDEFDIYGQESIDGKSKILRLYFSTINKYRHHVTDSLEMKNLKLFPFHKVASIKNIHFDSDDKRNFPFAKIYMVEKLTPNQFKIIEVRSYIGSDEFTRSPTN